MTMPAQRSVPALAALWLTVSLAGLLTVAAEAANRSGDATKIVIAHRGASGYLPEHTLPAYAMAYAMGSDYIEPDLVMTRDGVLIALHDIHLEATTDVEEVFPERARADGRWYAADFTIEEIKRLKAQERAGSDGAAVFPDRFRADSEGFQVPTLRELIELVQELNRITGCTVGIYPETKDPAFHADAGLPMEEGLLSILAEYGYEGRDALVFIQSFDPANLQEMRFTLGTDLPLVQLISGSQQDLLTDDGLDLIATYADGIGPSKGLIEADRKLVRRAHARGLVVHPYTFRADDVPAAYESFARELRQFYFRYGVDGLFTDHPDQAVAVVKPEFRRPAKVEDLRWCRS